MRIPSAEKIRVPGEGSSSQGESGAKLKSKDVSDAQQGKIPAPDMWSDGGTHYAIPSRAMAMPVGVSKVVGIGKTA